MGNAAAPGGYHAVNIALHALNSCLLFCCCARLFARDWLAAIGAALWALTRSALKPCHHRGAPDLLTTTGILSAVLRALEAPRGRGEEPRTVGRLVVAGRPLWRHLPRKQASRLLLSSRLYDLLIGGGVDALRRHWASLAASSAAVVVFLAARGAALGGTTTTPFPFVDNPIVDAGVVQGRLTALAVAGKYVWLALWPATLSADYSHRRFQSPLALPPTGWAGRWWPRS